MQYNCNYQLILHTNNISLIFPFRYIDGSTDENSLAKLSSATPKIVAVSFIEPIRIFFLFDSSNILPGEISLQVVEHAQALYATLPIFNLKIQEVVQIIAKVTGNNVLDFMGIKFKHWIKLGKDVSADDWIATISHEREQQAITTLALEYHSIL